MDVECGTPSSSLCIEIGDLLSKLRGRNADMERIAAQGVSANVRHMAQRHHDILREYEADYSKIKANIEVLVERAQLFGTSPNSGGHSSASQLLLRERSAI